MKIKELSKEMVATLLPTRNQSTKDKLFRKVVVDATDIVATVQIVLPVKE